MKKNWFDVDVEGLRKLLERRGKEFAVYELVQNAWDEANVTNVRVALEPSRDRRGYYELMVEDDAPEGFHDLTHAYTMFAESKKKSNPEKRGVFNAGEKMVLALCQSARITTTKGTVIFAADGKRRIGRTKTRFGSIFHGVLKLTAAEYEHISTQVFKLLPPREISTWFNGRPLLTAPPLRSFVAELPTMIANEQGELTRRPRLTDVVIHKRKGKPMLYELGIPVVEIDCPWSVDIQQKVPLNVDRDNVTPAYMARVLTLVLNGMHEEMTKEEATKPWVNTAAGSPDATNEAVTKVIDLRYGDKRVIHDPSDLEGTKIAVSQGYTVIHGGTLSSEMWQNVRRAKAALPAGQVTPSPKPFHPDGKPLKVLDPKNYTEGMKWFCHFAEGMFYAFTERKVSVEIANDPQWSFGGCYGNGRLTVNAGRYGFDWFNHKASESVVGFLIHEIAHHFAGDHLSAEYHKALEEVGAKMTLVALSCPEAFRA